MPTYVQYKVKITDDDKLKVAKDVKDDLERVKQFLQKKDYLFDQGFISRLRKRAELAGTQAILRAKGYPELNFFLEYRALANHQFEVTIHSSYPLETKNFDKTISQLKEFGKMEITTKEENGAVRVV